MSEDFAGWEMVLAFPDQSGIMAQIPVTKLDRRERRIRVSGIKSGSCSAWLYFCAAVIIILGADPYKAAASMIEHKAKAGYVNAAEQIAISDIADKKHPPFLPSVGDEPFLVPNQVTQMIVCFAERPLGSDNCASGESWTALRYRINGIRHQSISFRNPIRQPINQDGCGSTGVECFPPGLRHPHERELPAVRIYTDSRFRHLDHDNGALQFCERSTGDFGGSLGCLRYCRQRFLLRFGSQPQPSHRGGLSSGSFGIGVSGFEEVPHIRLLDASVKAQTASGVPEITSKEDQGERRKSSKRFIVLLSEVGNAESAKPDPRTVPYDPATENATTLMKLVIGAIILVLVYAVGVRLGLVDPDPYENRDQKPKERPKQPPR